VVLPSRNRPTAFQNAVSAILPQLEKHDRLIAIASGKKMFEHIKRLSEDPKVIGLLVGDATVNTARRVANGLVPETAIVVETGDNDIIRPKALERMRKAFEDPTIGVVYGNLQFMDKNGKMRGQPIKKPVWEKGAMHRRCEVRGLHAYRKNIYTEYGGWYEDECPAGDHANAVRWEDADIRFCSLGGAPLVTCTHDKSGLSVAHKHDQHLNSQAFARGEYRRKISVGLVCWSMAGRRTKMLSLIDRICDPENVKIYACAKARYSVASDLDDGIQRRTTWWPHHDVFDEWLPSHDVNHLFVDRTCVAASFVASGQRVVVDICDLRTQRTGDPNNENEKILCTSPNVFLVFVSEGHRDYICEKYHIPQSRTHIIPNLPLKSWRPEKPLDPKDRVPNSLVYYGGVTTRKNTMWAYRYYYDVFKAFKDAGIEVHIYPSSPRQGEIKKLYGEFNLHPKFHHRDIYKILRRYDVGLAGYEDRAGCPKVSHDYAMSCYPNKATDYMMAGIPTLSYALGLAEKDVQNWGVCVPKGKAGDLLDAYYEAKEKQIDFNVWQEKYCMENQAQKILDAYDWVRGKK